MRRRIHFNERKAYKAIAISFIIAVLNIYVSQAQNLLIKGMVTSANDGSPLPGVSVRVKGESTGTTTANNGTYSISVGNNAILQFTFIGYSTREITVAGNSNVINVKLSPDNKTLQEVNVVSIGYGTQKRKDVTGSVSSISAAQIEKTPVTTLDQAIQGRAAGVQVTNNDGAPGGSVSIQIRGVGTFGDNSPLYVIDGYPVTTGLSSINQNDVATIDILKDASATAIYGNRASNGVVIITTKRGRKDGVQVEFDGLGSVQTKPKEYKVLNAQQFTTLANSLKTANNFSVPVEWNNPSALHNIDWQNAVYRTGYKQNYNLSIRGGNEKVQSAFSTGYLDQSGITLGSYFKRFNIGLNVDYNALKWLKASTSLKYSRTDNKVSFGTGGQDAGLGIGTLSKLIPTMTGNPLTDLPDDGHGNYGFYTPSNQFISYLANPVYVIQTQDQKNLTNYFLGTTSLEATIIEGLKIKTNLGINTTDYNGYYFTPSDDRMVNLGGSYVQNYFSKSLNSTFDYLWENTISYNRAFGKHSIDFVGGISIQKDKFNATGGSGTGEPSDQLRSLETLAVLQNFYGDEANYGLTSQFGRLKYAYNDKYIITGTVRRDGSSRFAPGNQYGVFPSFSAAWRIKNESFLKNSQTIYDLKLRGGYGEVGNQNTIPLYQYLSEYTNGGPQASANNVGYPFGGSATNGNGIYQPGLALSALPNPDLKWEKSKQTDLGIDIGFLSGDLTATIDYYNKTSSNFLLNIPVPPQTGFTTAARNVGSISNKGLEFDIQYRQSKSEFKYGVGLNITTVSNKIKSLADGLNAISNFGTYGLPSIGGSIWTVYSRSVIGGPVGEFYGFKSAGIFQSQSEITALNANASAKNGGGTVYYQSSTTQPGDRKYVDVNGDGRITDDDRVALGSPIPKFFTGLNFDASYKAFDFNMFWYASIGSKLFNYQERTLETFGATQGGIGIENISQQYLANAWTPENHSNRYARITKDDTNGNSQPSDIYVENGSYLRLKNIQLGYTFPLNMAHAIGISKLRFYISAQNLITITKYSGLDPEIGIPYDGGTGQRSVTAAGLDVGTYPNSKFYSLGLNVTF